MSEQVRASHGEVGALPAAAAGTSEMPWVLAAVVALAAFMEVLDISIANVSLRHIAGSMAASQSESTWILTSYLITNAIVLPVSGWLASVFGRKRLFMASIAGFGISSLASGLAPNLTLLILFRAIQGFTGGALQPVSQAILADSFPPRQRGMAFAVYGVAVVFAPAIGPTIGGWITDNLSWRWVFLINVPISVVLLFLVNVMVSEPRHMIAARMARLRDGFRVDYLGFGLLIIGLGLLQLVLDRGQEQDWFSSHLIFIAATMSAVALVAFIIREPRQHDPIADLALFKNPNFAVANLLMFMLGFILFSSTVLLPLYVQSLLGYTATEAGMVTSPGGFAIMFAMPVVGWLVSRVDERYLIAFGLVLSSIALFGMTGFDVQTDFWTIANMRVVQSIGLAFLFIPITTAAYVGIPFDKSNNASALINLSRNLGGAVGIAAVTTMLVRGTQVHRNMLVGHISLYDARYRGLVDALQARVMHFGGGSTEALAKAQAVLSGAVQQQALMLSYGDDFFILGLIFLSLTPLVLLMHKSDSGGPPMGGH